MSRRPSVRTRLWRSHFPYLLAELTAADGAPCWIVLNREYKPLGFDASDWVGYEDYPIGIRPLKKARRRWDVFLTKLRSHREDMRWFYDDRTNPDYGGANQRRYLALLQEFGELQVEFVKLQPAAAGVTGKAVK